MSSSIIPPYVLENVQSVFTAVAEQGNATLAALHASNHPLAQAAVSVITNSFVVAYFSSLLAFLSKIWLPLTLVFFRLYVVPYFRPEAAAPAPAAAPRRSTAVADFKPAAASTTATEVPATKSRKAKK